MADIVINPSVGKIDFFTTKGDQSAANSLRLTGTTVLFAGPISASSISTGGGGAFVTSVQPTTNYLSKFTGNSTIANSLVYDNGTNVGIGTTSPGAPLTIYKASNPWIRVNGGGAFSYIQLDDGTSSGYLFKNTSSDTSNGALAGAMYTYTDSNKAFQHIHAGTPLFTILSGGNVGIGTTVPVAKLHINSTTSGATLLRTDGTSGTLFSVVDDLSDSLMSVNNSAGLPVLEVFADDRIVGGQYGVNDFVVVNNKVGIGTNNPTAKLQVSGSTSTTAAAFLGGNVGIGTTSPAQLLELKKTTGSAIAILNYNDSVKFNINASSTGAGYVGMITNHPLIFVINDAEKVRVDTSGNVGIGTTAPGAKLQVDVSSASGIRVNGTGGYANILSQGGHLEFYKDSTPTFAAAIGLSTPATALSNDIQFATYNGSSWSARMTIQNGGNVGIGTTSPNTKLHIAGATDNSFASAYTGNPGLISLYGTDAYNSGTAGAGIFLGGKYDSSNNFTAFVTISGIKENSTDGNFAGAMTFMTRTNGSGATVAERMRIDSGGNVGIGTTSPAYKLHVEGTGTQRINVVTTDNSSTGAGVYLQVKNSGTLVSNSTLTIDNTGNLKVFTGTSSDSEKMRITADGNVGIGTSSPGAKLQIGTQTYASAPDATYFVAGNDNFSGTGPVGAISGYPTAANKNQVTASIFDVVSGWEAVNGSHAILRVSAYNVINSTPALTVLCNGNVGIGTTSPGAKLQVSSSASTLAASFQGNVGVGNLSGYYYGLCSMVKPTSGLNLNIIYASLSSGYGEILMSNYNDNTGGTGYASYIRSYSNPGNDFASILTFGTSPASSGGPSERMRITAAGYVGIGTSNTTPYSSLFSGQLVIDAGTSAVDGIFSSTNSANAAELILTKKNTTNGFGSLVIQHAGTSGDAIVVNYSVNTSTGAGGTNSFKVTTGGDGYFKGNLGIGTTSPAFKLDVTNSITSRSAFNSPRFSSAGTYVYGVTNSPTWVIGNGSSTNNNATAPDVTTTAGTYTLSATSVLQFDLYQNITGLTVGRVYTIGMWVKLGTATNFCLVVNNSAAWNTIGGKAFTSSDGLSTGKWTHISYTFTQPAGSNQINLHLGYHLETGVTQQTAGTVFLWNIEMTEFSSTWIGNVEDEIRLPGSSIWTSRGNVGIGTTSPGNKLEVKGADDAAITAIFQSTAGGNAAYNGGIQLGNAASSQNSQIYHNSSGDNTLTFVSNYSSGTGNKFIFSPGGTEKVRFQQNGNVGIGTTVPIAKLHVSWGTDAQSVKMLGAGGSTNGNFIYSLASDWSDSFGLNVFATNHVTTARTNNLVRIHSNETSNGSLPLRVTAQGTIASPTYEALAVNYLGNVGIGTTVPVAKLHINSTTAAATLLRADGTSGTLFSVVDDLSDSLMSVNNSAGLPVLEVFADDRIVGGQYGQNDLVVVNNKVGIGTNNPLAKLHVSGSNATSIIDGLSIGRGSGNRVSNTVVGNGVLLYNTTGASNSAFGYQAMAGTGGIGPGAGNCAFGFRALKLAGASCSTNCAFGGNTLASVNYYAINNNAFGYQALQFTTGGNQNAFGYQSLYNNTTGSSNSAFGHQTLRNNTIGSRNSAFGYLSLYDNTTGSRNSAFGYSALRFNTAGSGSVAFGHNALRNCTGPSDFNVAIGALSLFNASGPGQNTAVGYKAGSAVSSGANLTIIGYNAAASTGTATNEVTLGNSSVATLRCQVTTITALSDERDKTDINNVEVGLSFVEKLRPVTFKWDKREWYTDGNRNGSKKDSVIQAGFIAQELKALQEQEDVEFLKLVYESNPDKLEATPGNLMIPLIKAVQELSAKVKTLEAKVQILESK